MAAKLLFYIANFHDINNFINQKKTLDHFTKLSQCHNLLSSVTYHCSKIVLENGPDGPVSIAIVWCYDLRNPLKRKDSPGSGITNAITKWH